MTKYNKGKGIERVESITKARLDGTNILRDLVLDARQHGLVVTSDDIYMLYQGYGYTFTDLQNVNATTQDWMVTTPNSGTDKKVHLIFDVEGTGEIKFDLYEGADRNGSTELSSYNTNRNSLSDTDTVVHRGTSGGSTDGTVIFTKRMGSTGGFFGSVAAIGTDRGTNAWIFKPGTKYLFKVETFGDIYVTLHLEWFEFVSRN